MGGRAGGQAGGARRGVSSLTRSATDRLCLLKKASHSSYYSKQGTQNLAVPSHASCRCAVVCFDTFILDAYPEQGDL